MSDKTYIERLQDVNRRLNTTNIRGKDYAEVNQRILGFWELFPSGRIVTRWPVLTEALAVCQCYVFTDRAVSIDALKAWGWNENAPAVADAGAMLALFADSTGTAYELKTGGGVNSTSHIENAETSAIGRALGILGIGATNAIASAEEVSGAIQAQEQAKRRQTQSKATTKPKEAKPDKVPRQEPKSAEETPQGLTGTEKARRRLIDACNALALATGADAGEIMRHVAAQEGFEKTEAGYTKAAEWVEASAEAKGVTYEKVKA